MNNIYCRNDDQTKMKGMAGMERFERSRRYERPPSFQDWSLQPLEYIPKMRFRLQQSSRTVCGSWTRRFARYITQLSQLLPRSVVKAREMLRR